MTEPVGLNILNIEHWMNFYKGIQKYIPEGFFITKFKYL